MTTKVSPSSILSRRRFRQRQPQVQLKGNHQIIKKIAIAVVSLMGIGCTHCLCCLSFLLLSSSNTHAWSLVAPLTKPLTSAETNRAPGMITTSAASSRTRIITSSSSRNSALHMAPQSPQPRQPRRMLKKRAPKEGDNRRRNNRRRRAAAAVESSAKTKAGMTIPEMRPRNSNTNFKNEESDNATGNAMAAVAAISQSRHQQQSLQEYRPLVPSVRRDKGEDYWIDPADLEKEQRRIEEQRQHEIGNNGSRNSNRGDVISQEKLMTEVKAPYRQNWIGYFSLMVAALSIIVSQFPELLDPAPTMRFPDL